jgi:hypothetical protein
MEREREREMAVNPDNKKLIELEKSPIKTAASQVWIGEEQ